MAQILQTLGNKEWVKKNEEKIKSIFPEEFTDVRTLNPLHFAFNFKLIGIDWRTQEELFQAMLFLEEIKIIETKDNCMIRRTKQSAFKA